MEARIGKTLLSLVTKEDVEGKARDFHPSCSMIVKVIMHAQTEAVPCIHRDMIFAPIYSPTTRLALLTCSGS